VESPDGVPAKDEGILDGELRRVYNNFASSISKEVL
jgi:hypothetical protein